MYFSQVLKGFMPTANCVLIQCCLLYTSDAADERSSVDLGGRRIIKKKIYDVLRRDKAIQNNNAPYDSPQHQETNRNIKKYNIEYRI
mgnify:CR=1 FL=1